jgi:hypothetical protein
MRGRKCYTYRFERVLEDIRDARAHGALTIFLVGDNIALNVRRFEALCHAIIAAGLNTLEYFCPNHDIDHRRPRGDPRATDAARWLSLRFPGNRKRSPLGSNVLASQRQETQPGKPAATVECLAHGDPTPSPK